MKKRKKHRAKAASAEEILKAVGVTPEEVEQARKILRNIPRPYVTPKPLPYKETLTYSKEGKRSLARLAKSRWPNAKKAAEKLEGVKVEGDKITIEVLEEKPDTTQVIPKPPYTRKQVAKLVKDLEKVTLSPERIQQIMDESAKKRREEEEEAKKPPKTPTGTCGVCKGPVKAEYVHGLASGVDHRFVPIGPGGRNYYAWRFKGYHCTQCGIVYKFAPKPHQD